LNVTFSGEDHRVYPVVENFEGMRNSALEKVTFFQAVAGQEIGLEQGTATFHKIYFLPCCGIFLDNISDQHYSN
jgi:hypothetical protein